MKVRLRKNIILFVLLFLVLVLNEKFMGRIGTYEKALSWKGIVDNVPYYIFLALVGVLISNIKFKKDK